MLLEGVIKHLPRSQFHVFVCPIAAPGKRLAPSIAEAADNVVHLPLKQESARKILADLRYVRAPRSHDVE